MARFNLISIAGIYLTDDGLVTGKRCKTEVTGLDALYSARTGATVLAISGKAHNFTLENLGEGVTIQIRPFVIMKDVLDDLRDAFGTALGVDTTLQVVIDGDTGTYDLDCKPALPKPIEFSGRFINNRIYESAINLTVDSIN